MSNGWFYFAVGIKFLPVFSSTTKIAEILKGEHYMFQADGTPTLQHVQQTFEFVRSRK